MRKSDGVRGPSIYIISNEQLSIKAGIIPHFVERVFPKYLSRTKKDKGNKKKNQGFNRTKEDNGRKLVEPRILSEDSRSLLELTATMFHANYFNAVLKSIEKQNVRRCSDKKK